MIPGYDFSDIVVENEENVSNRGNKYGMETKN